MPHQTLQYGNCLYESVANCIQLWKGKPVKLRLHMINWARMQVTQGTQWGRGIWKSFEDREGNLDNYGNIVFWNIWILSQTRIHMEQNMILSCYVDF